MAYPVAASIVSSCGCCVSFSHEVCFCLLGNLLHALEGSRWVCPKPPLLQAEQGHVPKTLYTGPLQQPREHLDGVWQDFRCSFEIVASGYDL